MAVLALLTLLAGTAAAGDDLWPQIKEKRDREYPYESNTGQRYKYDLSNPGDKIMYDVDPGAQIQDKINPNPQIGLDRSMGQFGGGAE